MEKIRKGDDVIVIAGRDKGKRGSRAQARRRHACGGRGVNTVKKHTKPNPMKGQTGGGVDKTMPIDISNVAIFNPATQKADRVGFKILDDKRKVRVFRSTGAEVDAK